jgi:hypothetical protein
MSNYKHVYFRINSNNYYQQKEQEGLKDMEVTEAFHVDATNIFLNDGWEIKQKGYNCHCTTVTKDKQELYLHPNSFSGVVKKDNISHIENLIKNSNILTHRNTDIYDDVFDLTDEEYINILQSKRPEIEKDILEAYKTKRKDLYKTNYSCLEAVFKKYQIRRIKHYTSSYSSSDIDYKYIESVFQNLIKENKILTAQTIRGTGYRTAKEKELKATA